MTFKGIYIERERERERERSKDRGRAEEQGRRNDVRWGESGERNVMKELLPLLPLPSGTPRGRSGWSGGRAGSKWSGACPLRSAWREGEGGVGEW